MQNDAGRFALVRCTFHAENRWRASCNVCVSSRQQGWRLGRGAQGSKSEASTGVPFNNKKMLAEFEFAGFGVTFLPPFAVASHSIYPSVMHVMSVRDPACDPVSVPNVISV